ncbi:MAG TPA: peptide ABC transporter substrate-binding protein [Roseiarcus sp.]|nr:peptide ABC transporter substrate-binding protein [Roseiarcus sp.]
MARSPPFFLLVAGALLIGGLAPTQAEMVYRRGAAGDVATLDPQRTASVSEADLLGDLFEGLVTYDAEGKIAPGVAESWAISDDGLTYRFKLRAAKWSNGDRFEAEDFVFSFRRLLEPATGAQYAPLFFPIRNAEAINRGLADPSGLGVRAVDASTLEIELVAPTPYFLELLAHQTAMPLDRKNLEQYGEKFTRSGNLVSNGPFKLAYYMPNDRAVLVKNENFHDAASVKIDREIVLPIEDRAAALLRFRAGEIDTYPDAPTEQIGFIRDKMKDELRQSPTLGVYYYVFNTRKPPFDDARVRAALSMAIDRDFLAQEIWGGSMIPAYSLTPPGIARYGAPPEPEWAKASPSEREREAKRLLAAAGYGPGGKALRVEIRYNSSENHRNTCVAIADMWRRLGVETTLINSDAKSHFALLQTGGDFDVARAGWIGDYSDPQNFLALAASDNTGLNYSHYANPAYDALMREAAATRDPDARVSVLRAAEALLARDQPMMPLMFYLSKDLVSSRVSGWRANVLDRHLTRYLSIAPS